MGNFYEDDLRRLNKNKMDFPQEFVDKLRSSFPDDEEMNTLLNEKSFLLGEYLQDISSKVITAEELCCASEKGTMDELVEKGNRIKIAKELLSDFIDLYDEQYRSKGKYIRHGIVSYSPEVLLNYKIRQGKIKVHKVKVDPVAERRSHERLVRILERNEERRREGERIAGEYWAGGSDY